ncbi:MAG: hypothetical protein ACOVMT_00940 [Caulobacter sp.]
MTFWKAFWLNFSISWLMMLLVIAVMMRLGPLFGFLAFVAACLIRGELMWRMGCPNCGTSLWGRSRWSVHFSHYFPDRSCAGCGKPIGKVQANTQ